MLLDILLVNQVEMHSSSFVFLALTFQAFAPIFVHGAVSLLRDHPAGSDLKLAVVAPDGGDFDVYQPKSKSRVQELIKKVLPIPSRPCVPYVSVFFQKANKLKNDQKSQPTIRQLAHEVADLISKQDLSCRSFKEHLSQHESNLIGCFTYAKDALYNKDVKGAERLWALGIVAGLLKHLPNTLQEIQQLKKDLWKNYVYLEVQAALKYEASFTQKFMSHFPKEKVIYWKNRDMEECFERAQILKRYDEDTWEETKERIIHRTSKYLDDFVENHFLSTKLPSGKQHIKKVVIIFASMFSKMEFSSLPARYAVHIMDYLICYWEPTMSKEEIVEFVESDAILWRNLHVPLAKSDLKSLYGHQQAMAAGVSGPQSPADLFLKTIQELIGLLEKNASEPDKEYVIYSILMIKCTLHPEQNVMFIDLIHKRRNLFFQIERIRNKYRSINTGERALTRRLFEYMDSDFLFCRQNLETTNQLPSSSKTWGEISEES